MQLYVLSLVDNTHAAAAEFLNDAVVGDSLVDHQWRTLKSTPMLRMVRGEVNERGIPMDAGKGQIPRFTAFSSPLRPVVRKAHRSSPFLCGLSPPCFASDDD